MAQRDGTKCAASRDLEQAAKSRVLERIDTSCPTRADLVTGTLSVHEAGYAFLTNEKKPGQSDLFIAKRKTLATAMHGGSGGGTYHSQCGIFAGTQAACGSA